MKTIEEKAKAYDEVLWLEKQGKQKQLYIRFGEIPTDEKSKIYRGEIEVGTENGVSVYPAFETDEGDIVLGLSLPITKTTLYTQQHLIEYDNRPCYLVNGDYIGKDTDGQPLINNVSIIKKIDSYRVKEEKQDEQKNKINSYKITFEDVLALECSMKSAKITEGGDELYEMLVPLYNKIHNAYLVEKQNEQKFEIKTAEESLGIDSDTYNKIVDECIFGEQKPANKIEPKDYSSIDPHFGKPIDKVEPKFHEGEWIVHHGTENIYQVVAVIDNQYQLKYGNTYTVQKCADVDRCARLWDIIKDAKKGDVLTSDYEGGICIALLKNVLSISEIEMYCHLINDDLFIPKSGYSNAIWHPATKEQRDLLFQKMKEVGYEWDAEKKELKKIEQKSAKWSEEDERNLQGVIDEIEANKNQAPDYDLATYDRFLSWLKSLKGRVQPKVELTQLDKNILEAAIAFVKHNNHFNYWGGVYKQTVLSALRSLRPQNRWKPSELQLGCLSDAIEYYNSSGYPASKLKELLDDLKKLKEE